MIGQSPGVPEPAASQDRDRDGRAQPSTGAAGATPPREIGGREGPEPTRYGDWEKNGRCVDF
ncbi:DUF1674 domain-containing protein [Pseudoxanthomonas koreensis]|uniref:DUF1674 domain-containing protein n=1 Tax=Pseudoxanthomonas koreensis TaxID=266061 RepID=UPI00139194F5|nr:DUF1674 domain-containing protein [Pseudoxanthomonas koreensis]KAF1693736.1 DUF1674 domain-containing protein [Pseudoxanthomonas koreensis]